MFLEISGIRKSFGEGESKVEVLKGINAGIEKGEFCVLLGASGSGKSTLLNIIGGIDSADDGYIAINGEKTKEMSEKALTLYRRKHLGYIFQMYNLIPNLNIKENIEVGAYLSDNPLDVDELLKALYEKAAEIERTAESWSNKSAKEIAKMLKIDLPTFDGFTPENDTQTQAGERWGSTAGDQKETDVARSQAAIDETGGNYYNWYAATAESGKYNMKVLGGI